MSIPNSETHLLASLCAYNCLMHSYLIIKFAIVVLVLEHKFCHPRPCDQISSEYDTTLKKLEKSNNQTKVRKL